MIDIAGHSNSKQGGMGSNGSDNQMFGINN